MKKLSDVQKLDRRIDRFFRKIEELHTKTGICLDKMKEFIAMGSAEKNPEMIPLIRAKIKEYRTLERKRQACINRACNRESLLSGKIKIVQP